MIKEVLDTMIELAESGMTMVCVRRVCAAGGGPVVFMDRGQIVESGPPHEETLRTEPLKLFLGQILAH